MSSAFRERESRLSKKNIFLSLGSEMKAWETIRLLLACQHAYERLAKVSSMREEQQRRLDASKSEMRSMNYKIQRLVAELNSSNEDIKDKELEIKELEGRKRKLKAESVRASNNKLYQEIIQEIERCKEKIDKLETAILEVLIHKDSIIFELEKAKILQHDFSQQRDKEDQEILNALEVLDADELQEKENLQKLEREFPAEDEWLQHFMSLIKQGKRNAIVEIVQETCPGCHLEICTSLLQEASILDNIVKCEFCDRIIFSTIGATRHCVSDEDIEHGRLPLPPQLALRAKKTMRIRDVWGNWHEAEVTGNWLTGLKKLFDVHALSPGEQVKLIKGGHNDDALRFEPEMVTRQELNLIVTRIESSDQPLALDSVIAELLKKKVHIYRLQLLTSKVRSELEKSEGIYFRGNLVWHRSLTELPKPGIIPPLLDFPPKIPSLPSPPPDETSITLDKESIEIGMFVLRTEFRAYFAGVNSGEKVTLRFGVSEDFEVEFDAAIPAIKGQALRSWYKSNGLEPGDKVTLTVRNGEQRVFHIHTEWKRDLYRLLEQWRQGTLSCGDRPRDLLYGLLSEANQALHYRDLWSWAAEVSSLRIGTVISTLSRYNRRLFCNVGGGCWGLFEWSSEKLLKERQRSGGTLVTTQLSHPDEQAIWKAIYEIENNDLVYKLLKHTGSDLSYSDIARKLAEMLNVNVDHLIESSFLNVHDERLQRLANGSWTLKEFIRPLSPEIKPVTPPSQETDLMLKESRTPWLLTRWFWYIFAALLGVLALIWILVTR